MSNKIKKIPDYKITIESSDSGYTLKAGCFVAVFNDSDEMLNSIKQILEETPKKIESEIPTNSHTQLIEMLKGRANMHTTVERR